MQGTFVELVTIESKALEPSKEAKRNFWELIGVEESEESEVSTRKH